jgi:hypothetical protein
MGKHDVAEVRKACGASFEPAADGSGYGCTKDCKGGKCTVACDNNNNCTGSTPDKKVTGATRTDTGARKPTLAAVLTGNTQGKPLLNETKKSGGLVQSQNKLTSTPSGSGSNLMTRGSAVSGTGLKTKQDLGTTTKR